MTERNRKRGPRVLVVLALTAAVALGVSAQAQAWNTGSFCGAAYTPAHSWCYWGSPNYAAFTYSEADYYGGGTFNICAAFNEQGTFATVKKTCDSNSFSSVRWCQAVFPRSLAAGVGNTDNNPHTIYGWASTDINGC